jgi:prephenate dehydrogenase
MKKVAIIGVGLMGGSLGLALRKRPGARGRWKVTGAGRHIDKLRLAHKLGAVDDFTTDFRKAAERADIIVVCAPVGKISGIVKKVLPYAAPGAIITDVGSVKRKVVKDAEAVIKESGRKDVFFVGGHPLAGSEKTGVANADPGLYEKAVVVLTPAGNMADKSVREVSALWRAAGAKIEVMPPKKHDAFVASTSHLPHIISAALVNVVANINRADPAAKKLLAGSFRDITRISNSDPENWAGICAMNWDNVIKAILSLMMELRPAVSALRLSNEGLLKEYFERAKTERWQLLRSLRGKK